MQVLEQVEKEAVLQAMSDDYTRKIITSTIASEKSIEEISEDNRIPISTCYRRVHELVGLRLLRIEHTVITPRGKKYETFRSEVRGAKISLCSGEIAIDIKPNPREPEEKLHRIFQAGEQCEENENNRSSQSAPMLLSQVASMSRCQ